MAKWTGFLRPGGFRFNGLHLRLESDASRWVAANGGVQAMWDAYFAACQVRMCVVHPRFVPAMRQCDSPYPDPQPGPDADGNCNRSLSYSPHASLLSLDLLSHPL